MEEQAKGETRVYRARLTYNPRLSLNAFSQIWNMGNLPRNSLLSFFLTRASSRGGEDTEYRLRFGTRLVLPSTFILIQPRKPCLLVPP